ncbi:uncharacterized protein LACBIDRAFT_304351 [Laccaria bicolor S238N-H82]|uniref:Predicted protein n=1 Tax=Laccaria bicolor (strain S238N-H82 / ATCC MYA-4686) TaxID=486041 RepID=B0DLG2_LACBS|nr:uncharacterized protein LACBIDRAFT_304351 [Laccaria bicolor S238N-H82]EDR04643.1 predicted protein [Laccaria bicolor S238N-H82]|eukprot:XP_001884815.1 predicted protein [Laccaria bicolor S238N-H82]
MAEKPFGYRLEYATSSRSKCKGPEPCQGSPIENGQFRVGSLVDFRGATSFAWRHWGCTTPKTSESMRGYFGEPSELGGYEDLKPEDQAKVVKAWQEGKIDPADVPESARKPAAAEDEDEEVGELR